MENIDFATLFQGIGTMMASGWVLASARVFLALLGLLLIYLGWKGILEPMVMIPMGLGMVAINCGTLIMPDGTLGNLFLDPMLSDTDQLMNTMQIDFLQPVYTLTFSSGPLLYGSTFMLGVLLGVLCDAHLLLDPKILKLLVLGIVALLLSGIGGIIGGYIMYIIKRGNYNPVIGIAAVSCVPTTAKVAQKIVSKDNPDSFILGDALGANISGVITSAIITGIYITVIPYL